MFEKAPQLYDLFYEWKDYRAEAERLRELVDGRRPGSKTLLDVACGTGAHLIHLREWFEVVGLDIDPGLLKVASQKLRDVPLYRGDMRDFDLGRRFDVVTCLFSSIGYMQTVADLQLAVQTMARHLSPGGLLIVEPWFSPETFDPNHLGRTILVQRPDLEAVRMNGSRVERGRSILDLHYLVARPGKVEHLTEEHVLGLFADAAYRQAFEQAGLETEHDPVGLMGRGLWIGQRASEMVG
jgi:ubiquinone/menaquinone biosynthesis C-methylase UbiE